MAEKLSFERANHLLRCEEGVLYWRVSKRGAVKENSEAGCVSSQGYTIVEVGGFRYQAHRLVWLLAHKSWPKAGIDHINGVRTDNRIENLRDAGQSINGQNLKRAKRNSRTQLLGASPHQGKFVAQIVLRGKTKYLGCFNTPEEAHAAYLQAKRSLHEGNTL